MLLDFSNFTFNYPAVTSQWEKDIIAFVEEYIHQTQIQVQTSGSTGKAKSFAVDKTAMKLSARMTGEYLDLHKRNTALLCLPVAYIAGKMMIVRAIELGLKLYCIEPKSTVVWNGEKIDFAALTPMQAENSLEFIQNCRKLILGGAQVSQELELKLKKYKTQIFETYGMTETLSHIAMRKLNQQKEFRILKDIEIREDDGQLVIKTPYFAEEFKTNDMVELTSDKTFILNGRVDNVINSAGIKINPETLENQLKPFISQPFIVHYKLDKTLGQKIVLIIESNKKIKVEYPKDLIPKNIQPKEIIFLKSFPRTESGKIKRKEIMV